MTATVIVIPSITRHTPPDHLSSIIHYSPDCGCIEINHIPGTLEVIFLSWRANILDGSEQPLLYANLYDNRQTGSCQLDQKCNSWRNFDVMSEFEILGEQLSGIESFDAVAFEDLIEKKPGISVERLKVSIIVSEEQNVRR